MRVGNAPLPQTLAIPRAIPMGYGEQPYDSFVDGLEAFGPGGRPLSISRGVGPRWVIGGAGQLGIVRYKIDLRRLESDIHSASDASKARRGYVGLLGYSVLAYLEGLEERPVRLRVEAPERWPAFSTLAPAAPARLGGVVARADNYYSLADSQVLMGPDLEVRRVDGEPPLFVASYAESVLDASLVAATGREALDALVAYFGSAPFRHYSIVVEVLRPVSAAAPVRLQHGAHGQRNVLSRRARSAHGRVARTSDPTGPLQLRAPHRPLLDPQAQLRPRLLPLHVE